jgi:hypothetical protein
MDPTMADQELSIITLSIASSASITTIGKSWGGGCHWRGFI